MISNLLQKFRKTPRQEFVAPEPASDLDMIVFGKDEQKWITVLQNAVVYFLVIRFSDLLQLTMV